MCKRIIGVPQELARSCRLLGDIPAGRLVVTESGIEGNYTLGRRYWHPDWSTAGWLEYAKGVLIGKNALDLTFIESAFLAGLVRSPSGFDPINNPERSRARWLQVIERLEDEGKITAANAVELADFAIPSRVKTITSTS